MKYKYILALIISNLLLIGCSSGYKTLKNSSYEGKDKFSKYLYLEYKKQAIFEAEKMHDWNSTKLYSDKALKAAKGEKIKPEEISYWNIKNTNINELNKAYINLMKVYQEAIKKDPYNLAIAISSLDCWSEQEEEGWQTWDIKSCKNKHLSSMHKIYKKLNQKNEENKKVNKSVSVVTTDYKDNVQQIIFFDFDKSKLSNTSVNEVKRFLIQNKKNIKKYLVVGHTDTKGSKEYNKTLSVERALTIKNLLIKLGIEANNIKILGQGESALAFYTKDEVAHPANRRAVISPLN